MFFDMPDPDLVEAVEAGDLFFCQECHEITDGNCCPECHVGNCEACGIAVTHGNIGERDFIEPKIVLCKPCHLHGNDDHSLCGSHEDCGFKVQNVIDAVQRAMKPKLTHVEKTALSLLR